MCFFFFLIFIILFFSIRLFCCYFCSSFLLWVGSQNGECHNTQLLSAPSLLFSYYYFSFIAVLPLVTSSTVPLLSLTFCLFVCLFFCFFDCSLPPLLDHIPWFVWQSTDGLKQLIATADIQLYVAMYRAVPFRMTLLIYEIRLWFMTTTTVRQCGIKPWVSINRREALVHPRVFLVRISLSIWWVLLQVMVIVLVWMPVEQQTEREAKR